MKDTEYLDEIHRYLLGEMNEEEVTAFEARMATDKELEADVQLEKELQFLVRAQRQMELRRVLDEAHREEGQTNKNSEGKKKGGTIRPPFLKWIKVGMPIAAAILVAAVMVFRPFAGAMSLPELAVDYDIPPEEYFKERASGPFEIPEGYIMAGEYEKALPLMDSLTLDNTERFLWGLALKGMEQYARAIPFFEAILEDTNSEWEDDAIWELGIIALRNDKKEDAEKYMTWLVVNGGNHDGDAKKILKRMEKITKSTRSTTPTSDTLSFPHNHSFLHGCEERGYSLGES